MQVDALPGHKYLGKVTAVYPAASATNRVFSLRVTITDPGHELRPGMFARGAIITDIARNATLVPANALVPLASASGFTPNSSSNETIAAGTQTSAQQVVVVGPDNTAQPQPVKIGIQNQKQAQITSGVQPGQTIIIVGQQGLKKGQKIAVVDANGAVIGGGKRSAQAAP